jgi:sugar lactone lactonase YvrE
MNDLLQKTTLFADGLDHPECVAVHIDGTVWAGGEGGQIYRVPPGGGEVKEVVNTGGFILGIAFNPGCEWLAICDSGKKCIWRLDLQTNELRLFSKGAGGHLFNIPNYATFDSAGDLYVSESGNFNEVKGKILKFSRDGEGRIWHEGPFNFTNGMALCKGETHLYVVSSWLPGVERIEISPDGSAGRREVFCTLPRTVPDGIAFDEDENLYISCYTPNAIYKVWPNQTTALLVEDWEAHILSNPTNIAFGGSRLDQLFTANLGRWHLNRIDIGVRGLPLASHRKNKFK